jgi:hypothetical protein
MQISSYVVIGSLIETRPCTLLTAVARRILQLDKLGWHGEKEKIGAAAQQSSCSSQTSKKNVIRNPFDNVLARLNFQSFQQKEGP